MKAPLLRRYLHHPNLLQSHPEEVFGRGRPGVVCERVMELARQLPPASFEEKEFEFEMLKQQAF